MRLFTALRRPALALFGAALVACLALALASTAQARTDDRAKDVYWIHGFSHNESIDCAKEFAVMKERFRSWGFTGRWATVGYYTGDKNCTMAEGHGSYHSRHAGGHSRDRHTVNDPLEHIAYHLAWLIYDLSTKHGRTVDVVAHSMGGLLIRYAIAQTRNHDPDFPPSLRIEDVVTMGTPHGGVRNSWLTIGCGTFAYQCREMSAGSDFLKWLEDDDRNSNGWNPQSSVPTDWSTFGSDDDDFAAADRAAGTARDRSPSHDYIGSCHKTWYKTADDIEHGDFKTDASSALTADVYRYNCNGGGWRSDPDSHWPIRRAARALTLGTE
ncbi:MAG TPA: hypothetical protein VF517_18425 [Thermoleophilaceae bacterium]